MTIVGIVTHWEVIASQAGRFATSSTRLVQGGSGPPTHLPFVLETRGFAVPSAIATT